MSDQCEPRIQVLPTDGHRVCLSCKAEAAPGDIMLCARTGAMPMQGLCAIDRAGAVDPRPEQERVGEMAMPADQAGAMPEQPYGDWFMGLEEDVTRYIQELTAYSEQMTREMLEVDKALDETGATTGKRWQRIRDIESERRRCIDQASCAEAALAHMRVLDGWQVVPKVPTDEQIEAIRACVITEGETCNTDGYTAFYRAALAAAPTPPQEGAAPHAESAGGGSDA